MTAEYISQSDFQDNDFLNKRCTRKVYLVTYSQVDMEKCSDRERFAKMVLEAFDPRKENSMQPVQWAVSKEPHSESGFDYHVCVSSEIRNASVVQTIYKYQLYVSQL